MKKFFMVLAALLIFNSLFLAIAYASSETAISIKNVLTDKTNQTINVTGQITDPVDDQQVTLIVYKQDSDYKIASNILHIDQSRVTLDAANNFSLSFPFNTNIDENTLTLRMGGTNIKTPESLNFNTEEVLTKRVVVGEQNGTLIAGTAGEVTFTVTTTNIADGSYIVSVANLPLGVTFSEKVDIENNLGILTLNGNDSTIAADTLNLILTLNDTDSEAFSLSIKGSTAKSVTVGEQNSVLTAGKAGLASFTVTTVNIANGAYTATVANLPSGVSVSGKVAINNNYGILTLEGNTSTIAADINNLTLTLDNTVSPTFSLSIKAADVKSISVGAQNGILTAGTAGEVTFPVITANIANGSYVATVANLPSGVSVSGQVAINNNVGILTLAGNTSTIAADTNNLTLTLDNTVSTAFSLSIKGATVKSVVVGAQNGTLTAGTAGSVTFSVATANIANGSLITLNNINNVTGISLDSTTPAKQSEIPLAGSLDEEMPLTEIDITSGSAISISSGSAIVPDNSNYDINAPYSSAITTNNNTIITVSISNATPQGEHPLSVTIDGITSNSFNLVVLPDDDIDEYKYSVKTSTGDGGAVSSGGTYNGGTEVKLTATPKVGYYFRGWYDIDVMVPGAGQIYSFVLTENRNLQAKFTTQFLSISNIYVKVRDGNWYSYSVSDLSSDDTVFKNYVTRIKDALRYLNESKLYIEFSNETMYNYLSSLQNNARTLIQMVDNMDNITIDGADVKKMAIKVKP